MKNCAILAIATLTLSGCVSTVPTSSNGNSDLVLINKEGVIARTIVTGKGPAAKASCKGALCSAFGVESVSSTVQIDYQMQIDLADSSELSRLKSGGRKLYVSIEPRLKMTRFIGGKTVVEDKSIRRKNAVKCANEPYMYVLSPENGYSAKLDGVAMVTIKRTYAPGSALRSFETRDVDGALSPVLRVSYKPFAPSKHDCWHPAFKHLRP